MHYYTYAFLREDGTPYYIGKGTSHRAYIKRRRGIKPPKDKNRILILKDNLTEQDAFKHEIYMISVFGRKNNNTGILLNQTDGGEGVSGYSHTEEFKRNRSIAYTGRVRKPHTEETKQKIRLARSKQTNLRTGNHHTDSTKQKLREQKLKYVYQLTSPNGQQYITNNPVQLCKDHPQFELIPSCIRRASRTTNSYKGWFITRHSLNDTIQPL